MSNSDLCSTVWKPVMINLSKVKETPIRWIWENRIPSGMLTVLAGNPGLGKSLVTLDIAARVTTGRALPDGDTCCQGAVILLSAEDGLDNVLLPRLRAAGADLERVEALSGAANEAEQRDISLEDIDILRKAIDHRPDTRLVVIDPISAYLGVTDDHKNSSVRGLLKPLSILAADYGVAIVLVTHLRKSEGQAIYRSLGSIGFIAAARMGWMITQHPHEKDARAMGLLKSNIGLDPGGLGYRVVSNSENSPFIEWIDGRLELDLDATRDEAEERRNTRSALTDAMNWLIGTLSGGPIASKDLIKRASADGINKSTLDRAKDRLDIRSLKTPGPQGSWVWSMPTSSPTSSSSGDGDLDDLRSREQGDSS